MRSHSSVGYRPTAACGVCRDGAVSSHVAVRPISQRPPRDWQFMEPMKPIEPKDEVCSDKVSNGSQYSIPEYTADNKKRLNFKKGRKERRPLDRLGKTFFFPRTPFACRCGDLAPRRHLSPPPWPTRMRFV